MLRLRSLYYTKLPSKKGIHLLARCEKLQKKNLFPNNIFAKNRIFSFNHLYVSLLCSNCIFLLRKIVTYEY
ncbi:hypothetical protein V1477_014142 [Vespula maculifrons]|uniref:Uncharacterized protein n=1 Tax=Vespula maculifrons TaxID=7453 RepID=A0ABD2BK65_VESMC